jgi:uncharacterized protein
MTIISRHKDIFLYTAIVLIVSWTVQGLIITNGGVKAYGILGLICMMWIPGIIAIFYRVFTKQGFKDAGFKKFSFKFFLLSLAIPLLFAFITNFVAHLLDIRLFAPISLERLGTAFTRILLILGIGFFGALGEEIGWRGFLISKMQKSKFPRYMLCSGVIWALWHLPLVTFGGYYENNNLFQVAVLYTLSILTFNYFISWMFIKTQSIWIATTTHMFENFFFQAFVPGLIFTQVGSRGHLWEIVGGDSGLLPIALYGGLLLILLKFKP